MLTYRDADHAARTIESDGGDDAHTLSAKIRHEVQHATQALADRTHRAEALLRDYAGHARDDVKQAGRRATRVVRANPLPTALLALGAGMILAAFLVPKHNA